jgi:hypothetical protein
MFAAINAGGGESDTRDSVGETTEAQCARVTTTYERALHALHAGRASEAQGASRFGCVRFRFRSALTSRCARVSRALALLEEALADPFLAGTPGSASACALKHAALKNLGRVLDAAGDDSAPAALQAYAAASELDATDVVLWCAPGAREADAAEEAPAC